MQNTKKKIELTIGSDNEYNIAQCECQVYEVSNCKYFHNKHVSEINYSTNA